MLSTARSGFFQLVGVAGLNPTLVMACLQICRREGKGFTAVRALSDGAGGLQLRHASVPPPAA